MNIPAIPREKIITATGDLHENWRRFFVSLTQQLHWHLGESGYALPHRSNDDVAKLNQSSEKGKVLYNHEQQAMCVNNEGRYKAVALRPEQLPKSEIDQKPKNKINGTLVYDTTNKQLLYGINEQWHQIPTEALKR